VKAARVLSFHRDKPDGPAAGPGRRPDTTVAAYVGAFALGIVVAAVGLSALQGDRGDTVPALVHQQVTERAAAAEAAAAARLAALEDANALARKLVAALDSPAGLSAADKAALRDAVGTQTRTVERVRVVRVPVPGPVVTVAPAPAPGRRQPPARAQRSTPRPTPTPAPCRVELLGTCLAR
jgi:cell division septation protein DedD